MHHQLEKHYVNRVGWLRASVLGANDGLLSTTSIVIGVAAASPDRNTIILAALAGMIAGAMSMVYVFKLNWTFYNKFLRSI